MERNANRRLILLADDSEDDHFLMKRILSKRPNLVICREVFDGQETISYLEGEGQFADRNRYPFPDLLLLDLKMPGKTGYEVLKWIGTRSFKDLVIFALSTSVLKDDETRSLQLGASVYFPKPFSKSEQMVLINEIEKRLNLV